MSDQPDNIKTPSRAFQSIDAMWAWVSCDDEGEGILAFERDGMAYPMIGADKARIESLRPVAMQMCNQGTMPVRLVCFRVRENLELHMPEGSTAEGWRAPKPKR